MNLIKSNASDHYIETSTKLFIGTSWSASSVWPTIWETICPAIAERTQIHLVDGFDEVDDDEA